MMRLSRLVSSNTGGFFRKNAPCGIPKKTDFVSIRCSYDALRRGSVGLPVAVAGNSVSEEINVTGRGHAAAVSRPEIRLDMRNDVKRNFESEALEAFVEKGIYGCRFLTLFGVSGSLVGSLVCFLKGCNYVIDAFYDYFIGGGQLIQTLVEAIDLYLVGMVMVVFGTGLYELFVSTFDVNQPPTTSRHENHTFTGSNLFGLFKLLERPKWLEIQSVDELETKLGHVIVMILLVGLFVKSKKVMITSPIELLYFAFSILLASAALLLLAKINQNRRRKMEGSVRTASY